MTPEAPVPAALVPSGLAEPAFDSNAMRVLKERYFAKKADGTVESPREFLWRVASAIAEPERPYAAKAGRDADAVVDGVRHAFYDMMARRDFMPNTPCLVNAGRPLSMLSACFVLPVPDSIEGIFYNLKAMALIQKSGGGCVSADSRVWTTFCGLEPIEVLFNRATIDGRPGVVEGNGTAFDVRDLGIRTVSMDAASGKTALRDVTHVWKFDVPADAQVVVRTREGTEVQTSAWHPFMVLRGREFVEVRADELTAGDVILGPDRPDGFWPWTDYRSISGLKIDEQIGWLIGFTLGDGSFGYVPALRQERLRWFSGATDVLDRVRAILFEHGIDVKINKDPRGGTHYVSTLAQGFVASMLAACGFAQRGPKDQRIRIPEHIAKSPLSVVRAFVAGLLDSDGTVADDGSPSYTTASSEMAHDLAALLSLLGYRPTLKRKEPHGRGKVATYTVLLCPLPQVSELAGDVAGFMSSEFRKSRLHSDCRKETALALPFAAWRDELAELGLVQARGAKGAGPLAEELNRWSCNAAGRVHRDDIQAVARALEPLDRSAADLLGSVARRGQEIESVARAPKALPYYDLTVEGWNTYASGRTGLALIHNTGFAFSELRHQGAEVQSTGKDASGPVSFMKVFNAATDSIKQGGVRRGANMGVLRVDHPDIFHFMSCKKELDAENRALWNRFSDTGRYTDTELAHLKQELLQTQINNFNISVGVTDEFMRAVQAGSDFSLLDPRTKAVVKTVPAREIWDAIVEGAWQNGEPGVLFLDHPDVNPLPGLGPIAATNPCVTADTWVFTSQGARRVRELVGVPFEAVVDGRAYPSSPGGFFFTGNKAVFRVKTSRGFELDATADHPLLVERDGTRTWTKVGDLALGDTLVLHDHAAAAWKGRGNFAQGRLLGTLLGDGHLHVEGSDAFRFRFNGNGLIGDEHMARTQPASGGADTRLTVVKAPVHSKAAAEIAELAQAYGIVRETLHITDEIESASSEFIRGFLQSWFDVDGSVQGDFHDGGSVRLVSPSDADLLVAQRMLARLGIVSTLFRERRAAGGRVYHKIVISRRDMARFADRIGFSDEAKQRRLLAIIDARTPDFDDRHRTDVIAIEPRGTSPVFDCTIPGVHAFDANGIYAHNCGEQFLHGYDSCNLGSINVGHFYDARTKDVDWDRLAQTTAIALRFLDNVIDANIYPIDEIRDMVTNNRRVGLGIMGFADLLIQLQIAYGSPEAVTFAGKLMAFIQARAAETSETLARERGDFPNKHLSIWAGDPRPRRNAALLSIAPTGTISMIAGCSFGCEPYFGMAYTKHVMKDAEGRPQHLYYIVPLFEEISKDEGFFSEELLGRIEENRGSLKGVAGVPQHWQDVFTVAADVTVDQHIDMLAAFQKHTDNAVSKCVAEGTLIPTDRGLIPIERMGIAAEGSFGSLNDDYHVISHDGRRRRVTGFYNNGRVKTVRVRTKNGATLEASQTHHVLTITGWKGMSELQVGDLIVGRFEEMSGSGGALIDVSVYPFRNTATAVTLPDAMSPDLALWLGMIAADGHTVETTGNVGISERDESGDVARTFDALCISLFGMSPRVAVDKRTGVRTRYLTSRALARYVADLVGKGAANKHVPEQVLNGSSAEKVAFLNGVSLDGYVAHDANRNALVLYAGISGRLADELEALCRSLGLPACYRSTEAKADGYLVHQVRVTAELQDRLDPVERRKKVASVNPKRLVRVPDEVFAKSLPHTHSEYSNLRSLKGRRPEHCCASTLEKLHVPLSDPREYLVKVSSIEVSEAHTYDIEVEESHSYVVNGLVSHNTINAPNDDTRENVSRAIFRAYEAGCKGFTYYRDGSRTEQVVTFSKDGDLAGGNRDVTPAAASKPGPDALVAAKDELDIDALLAKANALLEVK